MSQVEDWSDGDFDLEHTELRTDHIALQDVHPPTATPTEPDDQPDWDEDFPEDMLDDASDEQTDTIKLSTAASSALKLMLEASKASASSVRHSAHDELEDQLRPPALDLARISEYVAAKDIISGGMDQEDAQACSTASFSTSASTSYRSMMGLSTDLTDPDSPNSKKGAHNASSISSHSSDRARSDLEMQSSEPEDALEMDFELTPDMNNLSLCSSLSRARSNTSLSQVSRDVWDDDPAFSAPHSSTTHTSASSLHPPSFSHHPSSVKSLSGESDADDEHDDLLDGLDLGGSIFEAHSNPSAQSAPLVKAKLEAMLDLKRSGQQASSDDNHGPATDSDTGIAAGLIITDDFDLSPSRIAARGIPTNLHHSSSALLPRLSIDSSATRDDQDHRHPSRTASHFSYRIPVPESSAAQSSGTRSEIRGVGRNRLRFKRSASDLQAHMAASASNPTSTTSNRPPNRSNQLTRKRSLPSMRTSPQVTSTSAVANSSVTASTVSARQRHNSGNNNASSHSRSRTKGTSRLTDSTAASRARAAETAADQLARLQRDISAPARPSTPVSFPSRSAHQPASRISVNTRSKTRSDQQRRSSSGESQPVARLLKRSAPYGSGAELDGIDDLPNATSPVVPPMRSSPSSDKLNLSRIHAPSAFSSQVPQQGAQSKRGGRRKPKSKPALIRSLGVGASPAHKTVKGMRWNAQALRWEGNEGVLRDFDQVIQSSTRPALISQLTGSSTSSALTRAAGYSSPLSPESSTLMNHIASGARVVGDMLFDPVQMRWIHKSGDEEEDVFAQFDDPLDDGDACHDSSTSRLNVDGDNTVRARRTRSTEAFGRFSNPWTRLSGKHVSGTSAMDEDAHERSVGRKNDQAIRRALSRGAFAPSVGIDRELWDACVQAEKRHAVEIDGCLPPDTASRLRNRRRSYASDRPLTMDEIDRPRPHLYYLEKIAKSIVKPDNRA
ncbi:uncharacterized protein UTRI_03677_B [Ustilago trichophora]|uniref:Uncharacterized protein n=1 Tax=Ustilago trichophora TaxID=86804 RepID=A0A5C3E0D0_9BASI|nr:uncharacterized protein UTRI_03677_B [Ustilago trichophora]